MNTSNYAFIDNHNLYKSLEDAGWRLNYRRFRKYLTDKFNVTKAILYVGYLRKYQKMYCSFREYGFKVGFRYVSIDPVEGVKGNVDADLIVDALTRWNFYDKAIIVAGDGDYYCLIKHLKRHKKLEKIMIPNRNDFSYLLSKFSGDLMFMNEMTKKLGLKPYVKETRGIPSGQNPSGSLSS